MQVFRNGSLYVDGKRHHDGVLSPKNLITKQITEKT